MPIDLKLLGGMVLQNSDGVLSGQIVQRRRLAFLAIIGAAQRATVSRDRLAALLWPEADTESARHRLSDSLYVARRALGEHAIVALGDDIRLAEEHVRVDVREFERALDAGETERAVALYSGSFLDGFHLGGDGEFDRWADEERSRLAGRFAAALRSLAKSAEREGEGAALDALRRLAQHDPLDASVTLRLMRALERSGDSAAALRHARIHQALRLSDLGLAEEPSIRAEADALVARAAAKAVEPVPSANVVREEEAPVVTQHAATIKTEVKQEPTAPLRRKRRWIPIAGITGVIVVAAVAALASLRRANSTTPVSPPMRDVSEARDSAAQAVAVFPFLVRGGDSTDVTGDALASLVSTKLDGGAGLRSIDPNVLLARYHAGAGQLAHPDPADAARLARTLGASYFVLGDIVRASGRLHLSAALYDAANGVSVEGRIGVEGQSSAFFELVDSLAARLLVERRGQPVPQLAKLASLTTSSLPALKLYLEGESLGRAGKYLEAIEYFERATAADSTFGLAYFRQAWARGWIPGSGADVESLERASRYAARLPERIRLTIAAAITLGHGDVDGGERMLRDVVARYPDDFDATVRYGDLLFHQNPYRGRSSTEAREPLERASRLSPSRSGEAIFHLITIADLEHRTADVDSLASLFLSTQPGGEAAIGVRALLAVTHRDSVRLALVRDEIVALPTDAALRSITSLARTTSDQFGVAYLLGALGATQRSPSDRALIAEAQARLAGIQGAWHSADSLFAHAITLDPVNAPAASARFLSLPSLDPPVTMVRAARSALEAVHATTPSAVIEAELLAGLLALKAGDVEPARVSSERYATHALNDRALRALSLELSARRLLHLGQAGQALALLVSPAGAHPTPSLRFLHAEVLEALGRPTDALAWYDVSAQDYGGEWYLAAIARAHQRLEARAE